jgi:hypothetical protein
MYKRGMPKFLKNLLRTKRKKTTSASDFVRNQLSRMAFLNQGLISMSMGK